MTRVVKEIKYYFKKYPWVFYYIIIGLILSSMIEYYGYTKVFASSLLIDTTITLVLKSLIYFVIVILILTLISRYLLDKYLKVEDKNFVPYPTKLFIFVVILNIIYIFLIFKSAFLAPSLFANVRLTNIAKFYSQIFMFLVNITLFLIYRKRTNRQYRTI